MNNPLTTPTFLYGTAWKEEATQGCVAAALAAGFRGIDTANQRRHYHEAGVGAALKAAYAQGTLTRGDLYLQTKFTFVGGQDHRLPYDPADPIGQQVAQSFASSLEHLHTDYLDSYVLHGPSGNYGLTQDDWDAWRAMEALQQAGKTRVLGVSNVSAEQLQLLCERATLRPAFVQNRCYAQRGWDRAVRAVCREFNIVYQGFSLLTANVQIIRRRPFIELTEKINCTPAQLVFAFALQLGMLALTGTTNPAHMREDLESTRFELSAAELHRIETIAG